VPSVPCDAAFDPLSTAYLLVACSEGETVLFDVDKKDAVMNFVPQSSGNRYLNFIPGSPGTLLVGSDRSPTLEVWNVSNPQPAATFNPGLPAAGLTSLLYLPHPQGLDPKAPTTPQKVREWTLHL
jgi:hypothetical protein